MKSFGKIRQSSLRAGLWFFGRRLSTICIAMGGAVSAGAARADALEVDPTFLQLTQSIDIRTAVMVSVLSLIILAVLRQADFKGNFGVWGGRFIVFVLVVLNIGLWATQV